MPSAIAKANPLKCLFGALRYCLRICARYASRSVSFCYAFWRLKLSCPEDKRERLPSRKTTFARQNNVAASSIPPPLRLADDHDDVSPQLASEYVQGTSTSPPQPSVYHPALECSDESNTAKGSAPVHFGVFTTSANDPIIGFPLQETAATATSNETNRS
jgi:hypothetical protein